MCAAINSVQSIDRVLDILEILSGVPGGMTLSELSAAAHLPASTTHRLVKTLIDRGYALKDPSMGKYRLSLRTFEIGCRVSSVWDLLSAAKPYLDHLASVSQEVVHLVERDGSGIVYLYKAEPFKPLVRMASHVGLRNPMYCTGVGKSILALLPPEEVEEIWNAGEIRRFSSHTITELPAMMEELALTRARGYALDDEEHELGVRCIAAAVRNWTGSPVAAVSISAPAARMTSEIISSLLPHLFHAAEEISRMMGYVAK